MTTVRTVEFLWRIVIHVLTTTKSVEGLYKFDKNVLPIANPVESQWNCCKPILANAKPVECLCLWRIVLRIWTPAETFPKPLFYFNKAS